MTDALEFDEKWQALRQRFGDRLGIRMKLIRESWETVLQGADADGSARSTLFHQVHSLCGSGATFGYDAISEVARRLEQLIDPDLHLVIEQPPRREEVLALMELLDAKVHAVNPGA